MRRTRMPARMRDRRRRRGHPLSAARALATTVALGAAVLGAAAPAASSEFPRAALMISAERRYQAWGPYGIARAQDDFLVAEGDAYPVNGGRWSWWLGASSLGHGMRISAQEIPTRHGRMSVRAGDAPVSGESKDDPLGGEFRENVWIRGAVVGLRRGALRLGVLGGALTEQRGGFGAGRAATGAGTFGLTLAHGEETNRIWQMSWDRQEAGAAAHPGRHVARFSYRTRAPRGWSWRSDARLSEKDGRAESGAALITEATFSARRLVASGHIRRLSPDFTEIGLSSGIRGNELGGRLELNVQPKRQVRVGGSADWGKDLAARPGSGAPEKRFVGRLTFDSIILESFSLRANAGYRARSTSEAESLLVDQGVLSGGGEVGWGDTKRGVAIGRSRGVLRDAAREEADWHEDRTSARLHHRLGARVRAGLDAWRSDRRFLDGRWASRERRAEAQLDWEPAESRRVWMRVAREHQRADVDAFEHDEWEFGGGAETALPLGFSLFFEGAAFLPAGQRKPESGRWSLRLSRRFSSGGGQLDPLENPPEFAKIEGEVFEDVNGNGRRDRGEPGIGGLTMRLGSGGLTTTAPDGRYNLSRAAVGGESVSLDSAHLPAMYLAPDAARFQVMLRPGEEARVDYPIRRAAELAGRAVIYADDGVVDGAPGVLVRIRGSHLDAFSGPDGRFRIRDLAPGRVTLEVLEWSIPEGSRLVGPAIQEIELEAGRAAAAEEIVLRKMPGRVLQIFRQ